MDFIAAYNWGYPTEVRLWEILANSKFKDNKPLVLWDQWGYLPSEEVQPKSSVQPINLTFGVCVYVFI